MARRKYGAEPKDSEFSHGRGLMPPLERGYEPQGYEQLHAIYRVDSVEPDATESFDRPSTRTDKETTTPVREKGQPTA